MNNEDVDNCDSSQITKPEVIEKYKVLCYTGIIIGLKSLVVK